MLIIRHPGHCIENLRRSVMCTADTNMFTFTWENATVVRPGVMRPNPYSSQNRKCVNFEAIHSWALERHVPLQPLLLKPDGKTEKVLMT
ncbi:hypothetical protein GGR56DRAFT_612730 [Xylariaceae sp. FL0804]|nr:hypothetical protein GGR56DRAFT_612730 [Xylariaceae sp. FL0804]